MDTIALSEIFRDAIITGFKVATPILLVSIVVGLFISIIQAATSINEQTMTFVPKAHRHRADDDPLRGLDAAADGGSG